MLLRKLVQSLIRLRSKLTSCSDYQSTVNAALAILVQKILRYSCVRACVRVYMCVVMFVFVLFNIFAAVLYLFCLVVIAVF